MIATVSGWRVTRLPASSGACRDQSGTSGVASRRAGGATRCSSSPALWSARQTGKRGSQRPRALLLIARVLRCFALQDSQASVVVREFRQVRERDLAGDERIVSADVSLRVARAGASSLVNVRLLARSPIPRTASL